MAPRRVSFGRVNRHAQQKIDQRPFRDDMMQIVELGEMSAKVHGYDWLASDLEATPDRDFMTGVLGFEVSDKRRPLGEKHSWKKSPPIEDTGAKRGTLIPFAVNLGDRERWIAFAPSNRVKAKTFREGFAVLLDEAAKRAKLFPADWEVVLIPSRRGIYEWLEQHPHVASFQRTVKLPNPGLGVLDDDLERMRRMGAREKDETYKPRRGGELRLDDKVVLSALLEGLEDGDIDVRLQPRERGPSYSSTDDTEHDVVDDWGDELDLATDRVLEQLVEFSIRQRRSGTGGAK